MRLEKDSVKCVCGKIATPKTFNVEGIKVSGWQCSSCKRIEYSDDINKVLVIRKLQKHPLVVKIGVLGASKIVRLPKQLEEIISLRKGETVQVYPESQTRIVVEVRS